MSRRATEEAAAWNGPKAKEWIDLEHEHDRMLRPLGELLFQKCAPHRGQRILDIGCGTGATAISAEFRVGASGHVVGVDVSGPLLGRARQRALAAGCRNVAFQQADAQTYPFETGTFDVAISRFGATFFGDPTAAYTNIRRALRPGRRFAVVRWQEMSKNEWFTVPLTAINGAPNRPSPTEEPRSVEPESIRAQLMNAGFEDVEVQAVVTPVCVGTHVDDAVHFFLRSDLGAHVLAIEPADRTAALERLRDALRAHQTPEGVSSEAQHGWPPESPALKRALGHYCI